MKRRNFLGGVGAAAVATPFALGSITEGLTKRTTAAELIRPKALQKGDTVGLIAPSTAVTDPDRIVLFERTLDHFGLRMHVAKNASKRMGDYVTSIQDRLDDLHSMFRDPEVKAVIAIRGGYGSEHILDRIDYDLIRRNPKVFIGYSDITAMHLAINKHAGLVTFHGPILLSRFTDYTQQHFRKALFDTRPPGVVTHPPEADALRPSRRVRPIARAQARERLMGGVVTLVSA